MRKPNAFAASVAALVVAAACTNTPKTDQTTAEPAKPQAEQTSKVDDALIVMSIQGKYYTSAEVKGRNIDVDSDHGVVTLKGKVDTETARQQAVGIAKGQDGVTRVDDQLTVTTDSVVARSDSSPRSPGWITTKIQSQYYAHPGLKPWNIDVTTSDSGVVTLTGVVDNANDRAEAEKIARSTDGVTNVTDRLRVKGETAATTGTAEKVATDVTDSWITSKIQSRYFVDDDVKGRNINVDTQNGVVTLRGTVNSYSERLQAAAIARNTDGVKEVHDELMIEARPRERDTARAIKDSVGTAGQKIEDAWITMKIQSKFFVDDQIKSRKVDVDTKNGVVTLKGTVSTAAAKKAAEDLSRETDGVTRVVNQLRVDPKA
jgi:osmotically-inducible protein OsmY